MSEIVISTLREIGTQVTFALRAFLKGEHEKRAEG